MLIYRPSRTEVAYDHFPARSAARSFAQQVFWRRWLGLIATWIERGRQRHALAQLDERLLDDVGISRTAAAHEIAKPFWR